MLWAYATPNNLIAVFIIFSILMLFLPRIEAIIGIIKNIYQKLTSTTDHEQLLVEKCCVRFLNNKNHKFCECNDSKKTPFNLIAVLSTNNT